MTAPRPTRSTTLTSGSSFSRRPSIELYLRRSLSGHWSLIEPLTHRPVYHIRTNSKKAVREIRHGSHEGPLLGTVSLKPSSRHCELSFNDGSPDIVIAPPRKLSMRGHHKFAVNGHRLYWKRDVVCREERTRRVYADTEDDKLLVYEGAEPFLDAIVVSFIAMKSKHDPNNSPSSSFFSKVPNLYQLN
jgi:hypothetical protein